VDTETEDLILRGLREYLKGRTTILISHRISTLKMADRIIVLGDGRILQQGTHEELIAVDGFYQEIYAIQRLEEKIEEIR
jgi:ATP-binding cassette subfamily B protein